MLHPCAPPVSRWLSAAPPAPDAAISHPAYQEALAEIYAYSAVPRSVAEQRADRPRKRERMRRLLALLGGPERAYASVLVAGTKGKGSTAALLASILRCAGLRVGRYTQPHLHTWRERTWLDGALITPEQVVSLWAEMRPALAAMETQVDTLGRLTTFEVGTALTLLHFARQAADLAVLEVGVGGRHDATNAVEPLLSVITPVSLDHQAVLGETLAEIAAEKAGVMRPGCPAILGPQPPEAARILEEQAARLGCPLQRVGTDWRWEPESNRAASGPFAVAGPNGVCFVDLSMPLVGRHQRDNATVAVAAAWALAHGGWQIGERAVRAGLCQVDWPGRMEVLARAPLLVVDGAHNGDSAARLRDALREAFRFERLWLVLGITDGKDLEGILSALAPLASGMIATRADHPRALDPRLIAAAAPGHILAVTDTVAAGLEVAWWLAAPDDLICVTGSLFVVGEAIQAGYRRLGGAAG